MSTTAPEFGTSGLRGLADDLSDDLVMAYVVAFAGLMQHDGTLLMARDLRLSSPRIARAVAAGAAAAGLRVLDCGVAPTPALAMAALTNRTIAVMVTGSHIPADRNGLKFYSADGEITKAEETALKGAAAQVGAIQPIDVHTEPYDAKAPFVDRYVEFFGKRALAGLKIGLWEQSSAARVFLYDILNGLGADVVKLEPLESFVAVDTEAVSGALRAKLKSWVLMHGLDAIVSTDGDGDRPLLTDEQGRVVPGDILGPITARALGAGQIVTPVSSNTLVELMGDFDVKRCRIGSPYVIEGMQAAPNSRVLGYEPNGGVLLGFEARSQGRRLPALATRDSVLPIISVLSAARDSSVAALVASLPSRHTATDRLTDVSRETSSALVQNLSNGELDLLPDGLGPLQSVDTTDGARMIFKDNIIITIRPSGNAPELRCYVEADSTEGAERLLATTLATLQQSLGR